jgi:alpha-tubulin suppressor-like RCC1 family protein
MRRRPLGLVALAIAPLVVAIAPSSCTALLGIDGDYRAETDAGSDVTTDTTTGNDVVAPPGDAGAEGSDAFPDAPGAVSEVTAGRFHTCLRFVSGVAMCWGRDEDFGELGNGTMVSTSIAEPAMGSGLTRLIAGAHDTCGLLADGGVCAGKGGTGELANGVGDADLPFPVATSVLPAPPTAIASGEDFTCAVVTGGDVYCVGNGASGALGNGSTGISLAAVKVALQGKPAKTVVAFNLHACALLVDGTVSCWGDDTYGQLGDGVAGADAGSAVPVGVQGLPAAVSAIGVGDDFSCAIVGSDQNSTVWCWGNNAFGQLGNGDSSVSLSAAPVRVQGLTGAASLSCGAGHACIGNDYDSAGIWCWGKGGSGQLGNDDTSNAFAPVQVSGISSFPQSLAAGGFHTCAILSSPDVECWGANDFGQLGNGSTNTAQVPAPVMGIP